MTIQQLSDFELKIALKKAYRMVEKIKSLKRFLSRYGNVFLSATGKATTIKENIRIIYGFFEQVNKEEKSKIFDEKFISDIDSFSFVDPTNAHLSFLEELVQSYIDILELKIKPELSINESKLLSGLREDLSKLKEEGLEKSIIKNSTMALEELERPKYLTCSMISARATLSMIEKIKAKSNKDEDKAEKLEELGIIDKGEISKQTYKSFLEAIHSARHLVLHEIEYFPDYTDANNFLSSSFKMAKLYLKYKNKMQQKNSNE